jgi:endoglycosylceramidase
MKFTKALTIALLLATAVTAKTTPDGKFSIDPEARVMRDADDRHVIFHGVNVVYKVDPYIPGTENFDAQTSLDDEDIDNLVKWGFNFVRLGVMWEGVETAEGVYNEKYLADVNALVTKLGEKGIYTLIDSHQDAITRLNCGEGMPTFRAKQVLDHGMNCLGTYTDKIMGPILRQFGACKSIESYGYRW